MAFLTFPLYTSSSLVYFRWAGIQDGRYSIEEITRLLNDDENFCEAKGRLQHTDVLVLDEMSMLSSRLFEMLEGVTRKLRQSSFLFGGLQVIFAGKLFLHVIMKRVFYTDLFHHKTQKEENEGQLGN
jgi:thymidine kinase